MALRLFPKAALSVPILALIAWAGLELAPGEAPPPAPPGVEFADWGNKPISIAYQFLAEHEGVKLCAYKDSKGIPTIGIGRTRGVAMGECISEDGAKTLFFLDALPVQDELRRLAPNLPPVTEGAMIAFLFNIGTGPQFQRSTFRRLLIAGDIDGACRQIRRWTFEGGTNCLEEGSGCWGSPKRRANEEALCLAGVTP